MKCKLAWLCEHDRFTKHQVTQGWTTDAGGHSAIDYECPGGVFLPDDTLVVERVDGEWQLTPKALLVLSAANAFSHPEGPIALLNDFADALAVKE